MLVSGARRHAPARGTIKKADLNQIRLDDLFDGLALFADRSGDRADADWAAVELFDDRRQDFAIHFVEAELVNLHLVERAPRDRLRDAPVADDLRVVAHTPEQPIGDA